MKFNNEILNEAWASLHQWNYAGYGHTKVSIDLPEEMYVEWTEKEMDSLYLVTSDLETCYAVFDEDYFLNNEYPWHESREDAKLILIDKILEANNDGEGQFNAELDEIWEKRKALLA